MNSKNNISIKLRNIYLISLILCFFYFFIVLQSGSLDDVGLFIVTFDFFYVLFTPILLNLISKQETIVKIFRNWTITMTITWAIFGLWSLSGGPTKLVLLTIVIYYLVSIILLASINPYLQLDPTIELFPKELESYVNEITRAYNAKQLKILASEVAQIGSVEQLESRVRELIEGNIDKFSYLLQVEDISPPNQKLLIMYCYDQSEELRSSLQKAIARYLRGQILEEDLTGFDIEMEIDNLISSYERMEMQSIGKLE